MTAESVLEQIAKDNSPEQRLARVEKELEITKRSLRDALRVIDVLVAVGKLKQGPVEEARALVNALGD